MKDYHEFQFGWLIFVFVLPVHGFITYAFISDFGTSAIDTSGIIIANLVFISIYLLFYGMQTKITQETLTVSFGIGLVKKKILLSRITGAKETHNNYLYGWGIRFIPNGMLYNISGNKAVELKFFDSKKIVRVGTQNTDTLKAEILKRIPSLS